MVAIYRDCENILAISPSLLVVVLLPSESSFLHAAPWIGATYICTYFTCLHTGDSTTSILFTQRIGPLHFVGINKHIYMVPMDICSPCVSSVLYFEP